jgi:hypothetical protein
MGSASVRAGSKAERRQRGGVSAAGVAAAGLLILMGIVFQLGELGYSHFSSANFWLAAMISEGAWNLLTVHSDAPALRELVRFWPLVLVAFGLGFLLLAKSDEGLRLRRATAGAKGSANDRR